MELGWVLNKREREALLELEAVCRSTRTVQYSVSVRHALADIDRARGIKTEHYRHGYMNHGCDCPDHGRHS